MKRYFGLMLFVVSLTFFYIPYNTVLATPSSWRINVGCEQWVDKNGNTWLADQRYSEQSYGYLGICSSNRTSSSIGNTDIPVIYQTERYGLFGYRIDVPNGHYQIKLHFAEIAHNADGVRMFDIYVEDALIAENFDIHARVGHNNACILSTTTTELGGPIVDGRIDIKFKQQNDNTTLSAVEILPLKSQASILEVTPDSIIFQQNQPQQQLQINNYGNEPTQCSLSIKSQEKLLTILPSTVVTVPAQAEQIITIQPSTANLSGGSYSDCLIVHANGFEKSIPFRFIVHGDASLRATPEKLMFQPEVRQLPVTLQNMGGSVCNWSINTSSLPEWVERIYPTSGNINIDGHNVLILTVNRRQYKRGVETSQLTIQSNTGAQSVALDVIIPKENLPHLFVRHNASGTADGQSWENAFIRLSDALNAAAKRLDKSEIEIWVTEGIYYENNLHVGQGIAIYGGFRGDETFRSERGDIWTNPTIVDGQLRGRIFIAEHKTVIDGFIIQHGRDWIAGEGKGAAILTYDVDAKISNNWIRYNEDSWAGAIFIDGFTTSKNVPGCSPLIERNIISNNSSSVCAAAIEMWGSQATVRHNTIVNNFGYGLEINDTHGPFSKIHYGNFYNNILSGNQRKEPSNVWSEARKVTNYCYVGNRWYTDGHWGPYGFGTANIFGDITDKSAGFIDESSDNYWLLPNSPCIDAGDPTSSKDADGSRADLGALPYSKTKTSIHISPSALDFGIDETKLKFQIQAHGGQGTQWELVCDDHLREICKFSQHSGFVKNEETTEISIWLDRKGLPQKNYLQFLSIVTPNESVEKAVKFTVNYSAPVIKPSPAHISLQGNYATPYNEPVMLDFVQLTPQSYHWTAELKHGSVWLKLSQLTGDSRSTLKLNILTSGLAVGDYHEIVTLKSPETINSRYEIPVHLKINPRPFVIEIDATQWQKPPATGWEVLQNDGYQAIHSTIAAEDSIDLRSLISYSFNVNEEIDYAYIFAIVDIESHQNAYAFWTLMNDIRDPMLCRVYTSGDGWQRHWVNYDKSDDKHRYILKPGKNTFKVYAGTRGCFIQKFIITNNPDFDVDSYVLKSR
ncbi:hypothetical protein JW960_15030 [candidate division KSB1 bacterium]|nr:hypothetical protein [candidate division KSB1 bacterium]